MFNVYIGWVEIEFRAKRKTRGGKTLPSGKTAPPKPKSGSDGLPAMQNKR